MICVDIRSVLYVGILFLLSNNVAAVNLETLLMPGKVTEKHAKYEEQCDKCHEAFSKKSQRRLCLDCHKKVATDITGKLGLHGRDSVIRKIECKQCHSDHLGRASDIVQFNKEFFDHNRTDFKLKLSHLSTACSACHSADKLYREAAPDCFSCHKTQDVHNDELGEKCERCHAEDQWQKSSFDHAKTKYRLTGKHKQTSCALCHPDHRYKDAPKKCNACHQINDIHDGGYGKKCQTCHTTKGWKGYHFDHDKKTKFSLHGQHKKARCDSCHKNDDFKKKLKKDCYSCHKKQDTHNKTLGKRCGDCHNETSWRKHRFVHKDFKQTVCYDCHKLDDIHKGRYGEKCNSCHSTSDWLKEKFNHKKATKYQLKGKHKEVMCTSCHKGDAAEEKDKTACHQCHTLDDVHNDKLGNLCQDCHNEKGWRKNVLFDHDISNFPLIGLHASIPCEACHLDSEYKETEIKCFACHKEDDVHKVGLGSRCESCHNPNSWSFWQFDHDTQSKFKLKGAHKGIVCEACHGKPVKNKIKLNKSCGSCHYRDDVHNGDFGRQCERCHNETDFKQITLQRQ